MPYKDFAKRDAWQKEYRVKNREAIYAKNKRLRARNRAAFLAYKGGMACSSCGNDNPVVLDFHHLDGASKERSVAEMVGRDRWTAAYAEIAKCIVLCANCHRIHHAVERELKSME